MTLKKVAWRLCYEALAARVRRPDWSYMNYGFAPLEPPEHPLALDPPDEPDRLCIQLYEHAIDATDLRGADVLEVGTGRGGGASYVSRYHAPGSVTGLDFSAAAVALCRRTRTAPGLTFVRGDAQAMPFDDEVFDAVVNVESSHCYDSMPDFLSECHRVLRPGGSLLWADIRDRRGARRVLQDLAASPFVVAAQRNITPEVVHALDLDDERRLALIDAWIPWGFRRAFRRLAGSRGTSNHARLRSGEMCYLSARLVKAGSAGARSRRGPAPVEDEGAPSPTAARAPTHLEWGPSDVAPTGFEPAPPP